MRLILTVGLYLAYIRTFCDYLLTGNYSWMPTDPAGLLANASSLNQVLARPDGLFLCALFAAGCYGLASIVANSLRDMSAVLVWSPSEVHYDNGPMPKGSIRGLPPISSKQSDVAKSVANVDTWGPAATSKNNGLLNEPPVDPAFSEYVGPADGSETKAPGKRNLPPDQPTK